MESFTITTQFKNRAKVTDNQNFKHSLKLIDCKESTWSIRSNSGHRLVLTRLFVAFMFVHLLHRYVSLLARCTRTVEAHARPVYSNIQYKLVECIN